MIPFLGFLPDVSPTTPGALVNVNNVLPSLTGFQGVPSETDQGYGAVSVTTVNSLFTGLKLDDTSRIFVGTSTTIEELNKTTDVWDDRTRSVGGAYACPSDERWDFAQFGDYTLATCSAEPVQVSTTAAFADISGAPQAKFIAVSAGFVMVANTNDTDGEDQWHCSARLDHTSWTPSISTLATKARLPGGGPITGLKALGKGFIIFKKRKAYRLDYVGSPVVFESNEIVGDVGCPSTHAAIDIGDRIAFMGENDFYITDGYSFQNIGMGIKEWFFQDMDDQYADRVMATYNKTSRNITWHYCSVDNGSDIPNRAVVFNLETGKWGKYNLSVKAVGAYYEAGTSYDDLGDFWSTYDDIPTNITYDSNPFLLSGTTYGYISTSDYKLKRLSGEHNTSTITLYNIGNDQAFSLIKRVIPRFTLPPTSSYIEHGYDDTYGDEFTFNITSTLTDGRYDLLWSSRWHRLTFNFSGNYEIEGVDIQLEASGQE